MGHPWASHGAVENNAHIMAGGSISTRNHSRDSIAYTVYYLYGLAYHSFFAFGIGITFGFIKRISMRARFP